jgi:hypothetical protein
MVAVGSGAGVTVGNVLLGVGPEEDPDADVVEPGVHPASTSRPRRRWRLEKRRPDETFSSSCWEECGVFAAMRCLFQLLRRKEVRPHLPSTMRM